MASFEDLGRKIDAELERVRQYLEREVKPATQRKAVEALRKASDRLKAAADTLDARIARMEK